MEIQKQENNNKSILEYNIKSLLVADLKLDFPCVITDTKTTTKTIKELRLENLILNSYLLEIIDSELELLIIGSNTTYLMKQQIKIKQMVNTEFMNIGAAIRTFNLLVSDERKVNLIIL